MTLFTMVDSPLGEVLVAGDATGAVARIAIGEAPARGARRDDGALAAAREQLAAYFGGEREAFTFELALGGTPWQRRVWDAVAAIPYGETRTYGELAAQLCSPAAARAVGHANGRNPACIVVPCHRVVGARGTLTGYAYGVGRKAALLELERSSRYVRNSPMAKSGTPMAVRATPSATTAPAR
jgi:methylated-DNA-[protein]-cysteine S-methyltransferase